MIHNPIHRFIQCILLIFTLFLPTVLCAQDYQKAWESISNNDYPAARQFLEKALENPATAADAAATLALLEIMDGRDDQSVVVLEKNRKAFADPYPYYYAIWSSLVGEYGRKTPEQAAFLTHLLDDPACNDLLKASTRYHLMHHYISTNEYDKAKQVTESVSNVTEWQYTGAFENISGCGFDKNYPPVEQARPDARFVSANNTEIHWFTPNYKSNSGWVMIGMNIKWFDGIAYAQSFVTAPSDMDVVLAAGFTGKGFKTWVNDRLVLSDEETRTTDFDAFTTNCKLKKGTNRILVQIGTSDKNTSNFCVRFLHKNGGLVQGLKSSAKYADYPKMSGALSPVFPGFAESYFRQKMESEPQNPLNYYLLSAACQRIGKYEESMAIIEPILLKNPGNVLFKFLKLQGLQKLENRTSLTEMVDEVKQNAGNSLLGLIFLYTEALENEKYEDAAEILERWEKISGLDATAYVRRINLLLKRKKIQEAIQLVDEAYKLYPGNAILARYQHDVEANLNKKPDAAVAVCTDFLNRQFDFNLSTLLARDYVSLGKGEKAVEIYKKMDQIFPGESFPAELLLDYYSNIQDTMNGRIWLEKLLNLSPFYSNYWEKAAQLAERAGNKKEALDNLQRALYFNPNNDEVRRQIRELQGKPDFTEYLEQSDPYELYKKTNTEGKEGEFDWYYVQDEKCSMFYPDRNSELYYTQVVKILNEDGIDHWKESSISFDEGRQQLNIEKAEVIKPNGSKISAEQNGNQLVFANLQVGDGIHLRYRLTNYAYDRMARELVSAWSFNDFVPSDLSRFTIIAPANTPLYFKYTNTDIKPTIRPLESGSLKQYTWETRNEPAIKDQQLMPSMYDVGKLLHVSTIADWKEIASWYGDLSSAQAKRDYEIQKLAAALFPAGKNMTQTEKARAIYTWILDNIRYSSVSFRQSGFVPQRASKVIQTRLGDCKDLATLYAALAREAGLKANLVLMDGRNQGMHAMELPSVDFSHCIVKVVADKQTWYLELTDPDLPFGSLPNYDIKAFALEVPFGANDDVQAQPFRLNPPNRVSDFKQENTKIEIKGRDLRVESDVRGGGAITSNTRGVFKNLAPAKQKEEVQRLLVSNFGNSVSVSDLNFDDQANTSDTVRYKVRYAAKNSVMEIGGLQTFKIPFFDVFLKADLFPEETRVHPLCYWQYEDADHYQEDIAITLPAGKTIAEMPQNVSLAFEGIQYNLRYSQPAPGTLRVTREITTKREDISAQDYERFRQFAQDVLNAETRWVAFK